MGTLHTMRRVNHVIRIDGHHIIIGIFLINDHFWVFCHQFAPNRHESDAMCDVFIPKASFIFMYGDCICCQRGNISPNASSNPVDYTWSVVRQTNFQCLRCVFHMNHRNFNENNRSYVSILTIFLTPSSIVQKYVS